MTRKDFVEKLKDVHPGLWMALIIAICIVVVLLWLSHWNSKQETAVNVWQEATPIKQIRKVPKVKKPIKSGTIETYSSEAKGKLKLPDIIVEDEAKQVISTARVEASDNPHSVTSIVDTDTGEVQTYVRKEPLPWLAWDTKGEAGMYAGIKNGVPAVRLEAKQGVFQVKALHFGVIGSVDQPISGTPQGPDYFIGAGVWARW
jgi:hypothetical protein